MKKFLLAILMLASVVQLKTQETWPVVSAEQVEREAIMNGIMRIKEYFVAYGSGPNGSACKGAIAQYLQEIGTPLSYSIYLSMKKSGEIR